jgi:hypothetical protein
MKDHGTDEKASDPHTVATKLFFITLAGVVAYALSVVIFIEVLAP